MSTPHLATFKDIDFSYFTEGNEIRASSDSRGDNASNSESRNDKSDGMVYANSSVLGDDKNDSSPSSPQSNGNTDFSSTQVKNGSLSENHTETDDVDARLRLKGGDQLLEESRTEIAKSSLYAVDEDRQASSEPVLPSRQPINAMSSSASVISLSNGTGTAKARAAKSPYTSPSLDNIPAAEVVIPSDANISSFTPDQLANFLRCFNVESRIVSHLHRKQVDGKRFSRLKDSELESLGMKNPVIVFFRDKSYVKPLKKKTVFLL